MCRWFRMPEVSINASTVVSASSRISRKGTCLKKSKKQTVWRACIFLTPQHRSSWLNPSIAVSLSDNQDTRTVGTISTAPWTAPDTKNSGTLFSCNQSISDALAKARKTSYFSHVTYWYYCNLKIENREFASASISDLSIKAIVVISKTYLGDV